MILIVDVVVVTQRVGYSIRSAIDKQRNIKRTNRRTEQTGRRTDIHRDGQADGQTERKTTAPKTQADGRNKKTTLTEVRTDLANVRTVYTLRARSPSPSRPLAPVWTTVRAWTLM